MQCVYERCHVHRARLQRRHSPYVNVQRPGFDLLKAGNRALASIEFITQRAPRHPVPGDIFGWTVRTLID